jgi:hypothetical protein
MTSTLRFVLGGLLVLTAACATTTDATKAITERAAFDLDCPANQLEIVPLPGGALGVRGCGVRATYVFAEPECRSARTMPRGDFKSSCTPLLDFKGHEGHVSKEGKTWDKAHKKTHDKAHKETHDKAHLEHKKTHDKAHKEHEKEHHDKAGDKPKDKSDDKAEDKAGVKAGD